MSESVNETLDGPWFEKPFSSRYVANIVRMDEVRETDCKICTRPYPIKPQSLRCGHTFCRACIEGFLIDDETLPRSRNSSDIICPTCTKGSIVQWVIDGGESTCKDNDFGIEDVCYDAHRKRTIRKYRNLYRTQLRYWKEMEKQETDETFYGYENDDEDINCSFKTEKLEADDDDIRGINHVSGSFIDCIIECPSAVPSSSVVENLQTEFCDNSDDPERHCNNVKMCNKDVLQSRTSLTDLNLTSRNTIMLNPEKNHPTDKNDKRKRNKEYDTNNHSDQTESRATAGSWSSVVHDPNSPPRQKGSHDVHQMEGSGVHILDICPSGEQKVTDGKVIWGVENDDSRNSTMEGELFEDQDERCSVGEWNVHLALIGFIIVLSLVVFVASILDR